MELRVAVVAGGALAPSVVVAVAYSGDDAVKKEYI